MTPADQKHPPPTTLRYSFKGPLWKYKSIGAWHFVTLGDALSKKIRKKHLCDEEGWGRLKVRANVGETSWDTAIWFDTKHGSYLLPIKELIRKKEGLRAGDFLSVVLELEIEKHA